MAVNVKAGAIVNSDVDRFIAREENFYFLGRIDSAYLALSVQDMKLVYLISRDGINWTKYGIDSNPFMPDYYDYRAVFAASYNNSGYLYCGYYTSGDYAKKGLFKLNISNTNTLIVTELFSIDSRGSNSFSPPMFKMFNDTLYFAHDGLGVFKITSNTATQIVSGSIFKYDEPELEIYMGPFRPDTVGLDFFVVGDNIVIIKSISDDNSQVSIKAPCFIRIFTVKPNGSVSTINWNTLLGAEYSNCFNQYSHEFLRAPFNFGIRTTYHIPDGRSEPYGGDIINIHGNTIAFASHAKKIGDNSYNKVKSVFIFSNDSGITWKVVPMSNFSGAAGISSENYFTSSVNFIYDDVYVEFSDRSGNRGLVTAHSTYPGNTNLATNQWTRGSSFYPLTLWKSYDGFFYGLDTHLNLYRYEKSGVNQAVPNRINIDSFKYRSSAVLWTLTDDYPVIHLQDNLVFIVDDNNNLWYSADNTNFYKIDHKFDNGELTPLKSYLCAGPMVLVHRLGHIALR